MNDHMTLQDVIDRLNELKEYCDVNPSFVVAVEGYSSDGKSCIGASDVVDIGTDGAGAIYIHTRNKMTPIHVDGLFFPIDDGE